MFEGKVALVTGAGKGIGKEIALELARGGAKCVINYASSAAGAESVAEEIRAMGSEAMTLYPSRNPIISISFTLLYKVFATPLMVAFRLWQSPPLVNIPTLI